MSDPIPFAGSPLDRAGNLRRDPAWLAERLAAPDSRFLPFWRLNVLAHESEPGLVWLDGRVRDGLSEASPVVLLGLRDSVAHFGVDISSLEDPVAALGLENARFAEVRSVAARAPPPARPASWRRPAPCSTGTSATASAAPVAPPRPCAKPATCESATPAAPRTSRAPPRPSSWAPGAATAASSAARRSGRPASTPPSPASSSRGGG